MRPPHAPTHTHTHTGTFPKDNYSVWMAMCVGVSWVSELCAVT